MPRIEVATRIENLQSGVEGEMYKETHSLYVIDNTPGFWRRLKPLVYRKMTEKEKEGHITCRGVVGEDADSIYLFLRDVGLEAMLRKALPDFAMPCSSDVAPDDLSHPPACVDPPDGPPPAPKCTQQTVPGEMPLSFK